MQKQLFIYIFSLLLVACSSAPHYVSHNSSVKISGTDIQLSDSQKVRQILNQQYNDWNRVPHRMGGLTKKGIDCSGLVYKTYREKFGIDMPRSTDYQSEIGRTIKRKQLKAGDLVFFKTGQLTRHVGMYIDNGNFLHVSTKRGVMISSLTQSYWRDTYWKAVRVH